MSPDRPADRPGRPIDRYDTIGRSYSSTRREDPRVAAQLWRGLADARRVVNVGAGTGNYEPTDRDVVSVEPSWEMIRQRTGRTRAVVRGVGESLPFPDDAFDAALAVLTLHHWTDPVRGARELRRVSGRQVVLCFEPLHSVGFWGVEYFPTTRRLRSEIDPPGEDLLRAELDVRSVEPLAVPADCTDGFAAAHWCRPEAYLDPLVRAGMSWLSLLPDGERQTGVDRLRADLESGRWDERWGHLRHQETYDGGYRIVFAGG